VAAPKILPTENSPCPHALRAFPFIIIIYLFFSFGVRSVRWDGAIA
jgi:hypothetical protein